MIKVTFYKSDNVINAFNISDHSDYSEEGSDIVCAAVSSAAYMAVNTITDIQHIPAEVTVDDGFLNFELSQSDAKKASIVTNGLELHLTALSEQYNKYIKVEISEV